MHAETDILCLNCGTRLIGAHCHRCGQSGEVHRTVGAIGHELAHGVFHVEGRIWRTLPSLVLRPGELTRRYVNGERARFLSPLAMFLFTVFVLFTVLSFAGGDTHIAPIGGVRTAAQSKRLADALHVLSLKSAALHDRIDAARSQGRPVATLVRQRQRVLDTMKGLAMVEGGAQVGARLDAFRTGWDRLDDGIARAKADPDLLIYKLKMGAYKYSWVVIPLSTPFVALLFLWRRRHGLYDHAVFVTYSITFMLALCATLIVLGGIGVSGDLISLAVLLIPPVHMYRQLRGAYLLGRASAIWRTIALLAFAGGVLGLCTMLLLLHGLTD